MRTVHRAFIPTVVAIVAQAVVLQGCDLTGPGEDDSVELGIDGPVWALRSESVQLTAFQIRPDGSRVEITDEADWEMDDPSRATVEGGLVTTSNQIGRSDVHVSYRGVTYVGPFFVLSRRIPIVSIKLEGTELGVIQFNQVGESKQLKATTRLPDGTVLDVTGRVQWSSSNPGAISVSNAGLATALVPEGASDVGLLWRRRRGGAILRIGDPPPREFDVAVSAHHIFAQYTCDSKTDFGGAIGEFSYQVNVIDPEGERLLVSQTTDYPDIDHVVKLDQGGPGSTAGIEGSASLTLNDFQSIEVEARITEWDGAWDLDPLYDADPRMNDRFGSNTHRGADFFDAGEHEIVLTGSQDCVAGLSYTVSVSQR